MRWQVKNWEDFIWWLADVKTIFAMGFQWWRQVKVRQCCLTWLWPDLRQTTTHAQIIYDASCLAKEYGYNRELRRFMSLAICTDKFHECNHTRCSDAFKSSIYSSLESINTEACEQTNHVLRKVANSTTFMSPKLYLRAITLFLAEMNYSANQKKWFFCLFVVIIIVQIIKA